LALTAFAHAVGARKELPRARTCGRSPEIRIRGIGTFEPYWIQADRARTRLDGEALLPSSAPAVARQTETALRANLARLSNCAPSDRAPIGSTYLSAHAWISRFI